MDNNAKKANMPTVSGWWRMRAFLLCPAVYVVLLRMSGSGILAGDGSPSISSAVPFEISRDGFIVTWLGCGPFPNPAFGPPDWFGRAKPRPGFDTDWLKAGGGERKVKPRAGQSVALQGQAERIWHPIAAEPLGYVNLAADNTPSTYVVAYAACTLRCRRAGTAQMKIGSNDGIKVWLNGRLVHEVRRARTYKQDEDTVAIRLREGSNHLLVKVDQLLWAWGFSVRLVNEDGEPLRDIGVELDGDAAPVDILRMFAEGIEVAPEHPALTADEHLVVCLRIGPTAAVTTGVIRAAGLVEDCDSSRIAYLKPIRLSGERKRTVKFDSLPLSGLRDGRYAIRVRFSTPEGTHLRMKQSQFFYVGSYGRQLSKAKQAVAQAAGRLKNRRGVLATITLPSLERFIFDAERRWAEFENPVADADFIEQQLRNAVTGARAIRERRDWFATHSGPVVKAYRDRHDGTLQPYSVYVPPAYNQATSWPLVISLHGATSNHWLNLRRLFGEGNRPGELDPQAKKFMPPLPDVPMLVACPNGRETYGFEGPAEEDVWRVLRDMKRAYRVDETRIYLTGLSMGGTAAWRLGLSHPDRFAALVPVCAITDYHFSPQTPARVESYERTLLEAQSALLRAENGLNLPIHIFHGAGDPVIPPAHADVMFRRYAQLGHRVGYSQYSAVGHNSWDEAYRGATIFRWFATYRLDPYPRRVVYKDAISKPSGAYWVRIEEPRELRRFSMIEAAVNGNRVVVRVDNLRRFSLLLNHHLVDVNEPVAISINGQDVPRVLVEEPKPISFELTDEGSFRRVFGRYKAPLLPGLGLREIMHWHLIVYGTTGSESETAVNRQVAARFADPGPWVDIRWPVKADTEVTPDDIRSTNLFLIGTPSNNRLLARIADQLPIAIEREAIRVGRRRYDGRRAGLFMICRNPLSPNRYVFTHAAFTPQGYANLQRNMPYASPDYVIFNGRGKVARAGFFNASWQLEK